MTLNALALQLDSSQLQAWISVEHGLTENELTLVQECLKGKSSAQEKLYKHFYGYAMSVALRYVRNRDESREILNESFLKVFNKLHTYNQAKSFKSWLRRIVINTAIDYHRTHHKYQQDVNIEDAGDKEYDPNILDQLAIEEILGVLQQLPEQYRLIFNLYEIEGYSHQEISESLGIPEGTSRSSLTRAKQKLREMVLNLYKEKYERSV